MSSASSSSLTATPQARKTLTPHTSSSLKRKLQVFIEVPHSPFHSPASYKSNQSNKKRGVNVQLPLSGRKNGTPLSAKVLNNNTVTVDMPVTDLRPPLKKAKLNAQEVKSATKPKKAEKDENSTVTEKFPDGYYYCHQCNKKRGNLTGLQCTLMKGGDRCTRRYCKPCLKNRYGQIAEDIVTRGAPSLVDIQLGHIPTADYTWNCPKCADICNCRKCRKAKGLEPTGKIDFSEGCESKDLPKDSQSGKAEMNPTKQGPAKTVVGKKATMAAVASRCATKSSISGTVLHNKKETDHSAVPVVLVPAVKPLEKPRSKIGRSKKDIPPPKWAKVPTELNRVQVEDRFFLREFVLRFAPLMSIGGKHLEDLDEFDTLSDAGAKSIVMNLLSFISADSESTEQKIIRDCHKRISGGGFNPSMIWASLSELREKLPPSSGLRIPEPLPPTVGSLRTRTVHSVTQASQLLPILNALIECAMMSVSAREEIENGAQDAKEENRRYYAAVKEENDRWALEREKLIAEREKGEKSPKWDAKKAAQDYRDAYRKHKAAVFELDNAHAYKLQACIPRFKALGTDAEGRTYFASTIYKGKTIPSKEERNALKKWGWFLAVWGKVDQPTNKEDVKIHRESGDGDVADPNDSEGGERWWSFSDPSEIKKLAKWITAKEELDVKKASDRECKDSKPIVEMDRSASTSTRAISSHFGSTARSPQDSDSGDEMNIDGPFEVGAQSQLDLLGTGRKPSRNELKVLVKNLNEYADLLAWCCGENLAFADHGEDETEKGSTGKKTGKTKTE